jgi:hypothetical protein
VQVALAIATSVPNIANIQSISVQVRGREDVPRPMNAPTTDSDGLAGWLAEDELMRKQGLVPGKRSPPTTDFGLSPFVRAVSSRWCFEIPCQTDG